MQPDQIERLHQNLSYNAATGDFHWKIRKQGRGLKKAGCLNKRKYRVIYFERRIYMAHRLAWIMTTNEKCPKYIDHIDGNPENNARSNLRKCNQSQNSMNQRISKANKTGVKGISWCERYKKWHCQIMVNGKNVFNQYVKCFEEAKRRIAIARQSHHNEFSKH